MRVEDKNIDVLTVDGFGDEWNKFQQEKLSHDERQKVFNDYFNIFPLDKLSQDAIGADIGCGSGRWAILIAPKIGHLHLIDASIEALAVAQKNLAALSNCSFHCASVDDMPIADESLDFAYSLGVLHHVPNTRKAIESVAKKIKPKGLFLIYLYYRFDNRPKWFQILWHLSDLLRKVICRLPFSLRYLVSQVLAVCIYWPLARTALLLEKIYKPLPNWPLFYYRNKSFYVLRTDALDRFGTRLEQRFTKIEIEAMLINAGFENIQFSNNAPFWCVLGIKK
ncbi:MAG: class I SAM-dependent methyltransferase [Methylococcaceae bacterium]